jgi:hypothetical protein
MNIECVLRNMVKSPNFKIEVQTLKKFEIKIYVRGIRKYVT